MAKRKKRKTAAEVKRDILKTDIANAKNALEPIKKEVGVIPREVVVKEPIEEVKPEEEVINVKIDGTSKVPESQESIQNKVVKTEEVKVPEKPEEVNNSKDYTLKHKKRTDDFSIIDLAI